MSRSRSSACSDSATSAAGAELQRPHAHTDQTKGRRRMIGTGASSPGGGVAHTGAPRTNQSGLRSFCGGARSQRGPGGHDSSPRKSVRGGGVRVEATIAPAMTTRPQGHLSTSMCAGRDRRAGREDGTRRNNGQSVSDTQFLFLLSCVFVGVRLRCGVGRTMQAHTHTHTHL